MYLSFHESIELICVLFTCLCGDKESVSLPFVEERKCLHCHASMPALLTCSRVWEQLTTVGQGNKRNVSWLGVVGNTPL